jgi:hypothetical protein
MRGRARKAWSGALCAAALALALVAPAARGAVSDPLVVYTPFGSSALYGPCGLGVDSAGSFFYLSDYYHHAIKRGSVTFNNTTGEWEVGSVSTQISGEDPLDGPCGLALSSTGQLYVNNFHRNVAFFGASPTYAPGPIFPLPEEDTAHHLPTGVAVETFTNRVYVDHRTYVSAYNSIGVPVEEGGEPLVIGAGSLEDGYGVAVSQYAGTAGYLYVPDAGTNTVKVYDPDVDKDNPIAQIKSPFGTPFISLRDSAVAVDRASGNVYFADDDQPAYTERPQATIYVYGPTGNYLGHLKYNVIDARPPGLAVDNSGGSKQGFLYVTSGNSSPASLLVYGPGSQTVGNPLAPPGSGLQPPPLASSAAPASAPASGLGEAAVSSSTATTGSAPGKAAPSATTSEIAQKGNLRVTVDSRLSPKRLPRRGNAPVAVTVEWRISTTDGAPPPTLKTLQVAINRQGRLDFAGLPTCPYAKIQPATTKRALRNCKKSLVGSGSFAAEIALRGQESESYEAKGRLLVFKGERKGKPVLYGQIYSAHPFATSFVITFALKQRRKGAYGTVLSATLPRAMRAWGNLTAIEMKLKRRYGYRGKRHSFLSAGCPAPKGFGLATFRLARTAFAFSGGKQLSSVVTGSCKVRR